MRLVSFDLPSAMGRHVRVGALDAAGDVVDLAAAHRFALIEEGLAAQAAARISEALLPGDMVALIEGGERSLEAARRALEWAAGHDATVEGVAVRTAAERAASAVADPAAATAARLHGLRAAPAQHLPEARS